MTRMVWTTSGRLANRLAARSQTAVPSRLANGFFSLPPNRDDLPAAGRMTANAGISGPPRGYRCPTEKAINHRGEEPRSGQKADLKTKTIQSSDLRTCLSIRSVSLWLIRCPLQVLAGGG